MIACLLPANIATLTRRTVEVELVSMYGCSCGLSTMDANLGCREMFGPDIQDIVDRVDDKCLQCQWQEQKAAQARNKS